jgi:HK97 family phage major capsid protein/HK97 family phage prohead protease
MANINGTEIDLMPTDGMRTEAERYRGWKADGEPGGTEVAATRASQILSGDELSRDTVIAMAAWFARHEVDKQGEGFSPDEDGYPSPGRVAWAAWGGDAGQVWSAAKADRIKALEENRAMAADLIELNELSDEASVEDAAASLRSMEGRYKRSELTTFDQVEERTYEFPFSSEFPVARYFGNEILSHEGESADLSRLNDGAPLLFNHNPERVIGVVERAYIDGNKRRGYARVRFSRNAFAQEILGDVKDGVLRNVSFGYSIDKMEERGSGDYVATAWSPYEISVVSIPADNTVGIGRSLVPTPDAASAAPSPDPLPPMENTAPDLAVVRAEAVEAERTRISSINALCTKHRMADLGQQLVESGRSIDEARAAVLDKLNVPQETVNMSAAEIGLSAQESRRFSFLRAINYLANPTDRSAREAAAFEIEASDAAAAKLGRQSRGITIPQDVLRRDLNVGTASAGGNLVATDLDAGSFIDLLRNASALDQAGATVLTGLTGNVAIPRQSGAGTAYWVAESGAPTESQQTVDQVSLTPKTVAAFTDYSRRLMLQSSIDVENMIRNDLATVLALKIDLAGLYGTGSNSEPLGLKLTTGVGSEDFAAATPTFAEVVALESDVATANALAGSPVYLMNAAMRGGLKTKAKDTGSGLFVMEGDLVNGYRGVLSNQVASGDLWFGNFADLIIGYFSGLDLMVDPYTHSTSGTVRVVAMQDVDIAVRHPESFTRGNDTL